ncbi:PAS domain S-box-containing protein OS=Streptomyces violarus OX=67380 GN=FHS41_007563 PE=4 SV=1 [Streptomyces violarus]
MLRTVLAGRPADDIVLMLARTAALDAGKVRAWRLPPDPAAVARARRMAGEQLAAWGLAEAEFTTELIVSELVTNALRYGGAPIELQADPRLGPHLRGVRRQQHRPPPAPGTRVRRGRTRPAARRPALRTLGQPPDPTGKTIWAEQPLPGEAGEAA